MEAKFTYGDAAIGMILYYNRIAITGAKIQETLISGQEYMFITLLLVPGTDKN